MSRAATALGIMALVEALGCSLRPLDGLSSGALTDGSPPGRSDAARDASRPPDAAPPLPRDAAPPPPDAARPPPPMPPALPAPMAPPDAAALVAADAAPVEGSVYFVVGNVPPDPSD